jgi:hypothetical protein
MTIGDLVRVLAPFNETYKDAYVITDQLGSNTFILGDLGAFDVTYLEIVQ